MKEGIEEQPEQSELDIKLRELELKEKQFELDKNAKRYFLSPGMVTLIAALFGIFASVITVFFTGQENIKLERLKQEQNIELERLKQEFQIIIRASENRTKQEAAENLLFFVEIGILQDESGKIRELAEAGNAPIITSSNGFTIQHSVGPGESSLDEIAACYGANITEVRDANPEIKDTDKLIPGMVVTIPNIGSNGTIFGPPCFVFHTIQSGDTWESIAAGYGISPLILQAMNPAVNFVVGNELRIARWYMHPAID